MPRVLVTGGTGFVGSNLTRRLLADNHDVHLLVRPQYADWRLKDITDSLRFHLCNLADREILAKIVSTVKPEWIFHLAAFGAYSWQTDWDEMVETNIIGTSNLVGAARNTNFKSFVNTGSSSEYGFKKHPCNESEVLEPNSHYAIAKAAATHFIRYTALKSGQRMITLRLYSAYGPWEEPNRLMPSLTVHGFEKKYPPLVNPETARDFIYIDDVVDALIEVAASHRVNPAGIYNVGSGCQHTLREVVAEVGEIYGIERKPEWNSMGARIWDTSVWVSDNTLLKSESNWKPKHSLKAGLLKFKEWFERHPKEYDLYIEQIDSPCL